MAIIKLMTDFDGVWTNQEAEADFVWDFQVKRIAELTGEKPAEIERLLNECKTEMERMPHDFGWFSGDKIAAYYGEDPFGDNNAIFNYIERAATTKTYSNFKQKIHNIKEAVNTKAKMSLGEFSGDCFAKATTKFKLEGKLKPVPTAGSIVKQLNSKGVEIVVVSNSATEKIQHLFVKAGQSASNEKSIVRGKLHSRGNAKKFVIDDSYTALPEYMKTAGRFDVNLRRSNYHKILIDEKPDFVIGDVFSLDLALPLYLRLNDKSFGNLKVIQKVQKHTPNWVKEYLGKDEFKGIAFMVDSIDELPAVLGKA